MNKKEVLDAISQEFRKSLQDIGATNGEVIEAMFPNCEAITLLDGTISVKYKKHGCWVHYEYDWWNAPYKGAQE